MPKNLTVMPLMQIIIMVCKTCRHVLFNLLSELSPHLLKGDKTGVRKLNYSFQSVHFLGTYIT